MDVFRLVGKIAIQYDSAIEGIKETTEEAEKAESKMSRSFNKIGAVAKKVAIASAAAIGTATVAMTKKAVEAYADYEQLVGGVQTLFKESSGKLMEYANDAYKTAGLSANQYMETVTSFSASLLQSLGGDTAEATEYANRAITDMSDNANKMGTSMEMIQNAYQGFAKQNYTMLDNLKLGYGGTQEEMKRLIQDAAALTDVQAELGVTVDANSMSFGNIVNAISVVQKEMGIMGTTSHEATETITGSLNAAKGAWENFLVGMADSNQDMDVLVENLATSIGHVGKNLIPRLAVTLQSMGKLAEQYVPLLGEKIKEKAPEFAAKGLEILTNLSEKLRQHAPKFILNVVKGIMDSLPVFIAKIPTIVSNLAGVINDTAGGLIKTLALGLIKAIPALIKNIPKIIKAIFDAFMAFNWLNLGRSVIVSIGKGLKGEITTLKALGDNILKEMTKPVLKAQTKIKGIVDKIKGFFKFKVSAPKIPMPHFSINPSGWKIKNLLEGVIPKLSINWHAKGGIFDQPTIIPTMSGLHGVGEAGAEAVAPIETLQQYVASAVASQNEAVVYYLQKMTEIMADYFPQVVTGLDRPLCFDADGMANAMAVPMDKYLGKLRDRKDRGR